MKRTISLTCLAVIISLVLVRLIYAHCDTLDGPVIQDARTALEKGDVTPVLKWIKEDKEAEIQAAFDNALEKREENKESADMEFFETLARIHRAGEGEEFTGIKPAGEIGPAVMKADEAITEGSVDSLAETIGNNVVRGIKERFTVVTEAKKHMNDSVEAGREYVKAYVEYVHYVEGLHNMISGEGGHHREEPE